MMDRADVAPSEKFLVDGSFPLKWTMDARLKLTQAHIVAGVEREVEFLRLGRTALIYQTRDASSQGVWNKQTRQWEALDSSYRTQIIKAYAWRRSNSHLIY